MKRYALAAGVLLAGCTSIETLRPDIAARSAPSRLDEIAYINSLREAFDFTGEPSTGCYAGSKLKHFRPTLEQGYPDHTEEQETGPVGTCVKYKVLTEDTREAAISRYLDAGFGLTDLYCQRYFVIAAESDRKRQFQRNTGSTVDALVNAVLGVANAGETALAVANAGFEAYDSTYQNIQDAFLVSPELENVRKLVHAAQLDYRTRVATSEPSSYEDARSVIERYAGLCSYTGMKQLVNDAVSSETKDLVAAAEPPTSGSAVPTTGASPASGSSNTTKPAPPTGQPESRVPSPIPTRPDD